MLSINELLSENTTIPKAIVNSLYKIPQAKDEFIENKLIQCLFLILTPGKDEGQKIDERHIFKLKLKTEETEENPSSSMVFFKTFLITQIIFVMKKAFRAEPYKSAIEFFKHLFELECENLNEDETKEKITEHLAQTLYTEKENININKIYEYLKRNHKESLKLDDFLFFLQNNTEAISLLKRKEEILKILLKENYFSQAVLENQKITDKKNFSPLIIYDNEKEILLEKDKEKDEPILYKFKTIILHTIDIITNYITINTAIYNDCIIHILAPPLDYKLSDILKKFTQKAALFLKESTFSCDEDSNLAPIFEPTIMLVFCQVLNNYRNILEKLSNILKRGLKKLEKTKINEDVLGEIVSELIKLSEQQIQPSEELSNSNYTIFITALSLLKTEILKQILIFLEPLKFEKREKTKEMLSKKIEEVSTNIEELKFLENIKKQEDLDRFFKKVRKEVRKDKKETDVPKTKPCEITLYIGVFFIVLNNILLLTSVAIWQKSPSEKIATAAIATFITTYFILLVFTILIFSLPFCTIGGEREEKKQQYVEQKNTADDFSVEKVYQNHREFLNQ